MKYFIAVNDCASFNSDNPFNVRDKFHKTSLHFCHLIHFTTPQIHPFADWTSTWTYHTKLVHVTWDVLKPSFSIQLMANITPSSAFYTNMEFFALRPKPKSFALSHSFDRFLKANLTRCSRPRVQQQLRPDCSTKALVFLFFDSFHYFGVYAMRCTKEVWRKEVTTTMLQLKLEREEKACKQQQHDAKSFGADFVSYFFSRWGRINLHSLSRSVSRLRVL